jgi:hypothetical protein
MATDEGLLLQGPAPGRSHLYARISHGGGSGNIGSREPELYENGTKEK